MEELWAHKQCDSSYRLQPWNIPFFTPNFTNERQRQSCDISHGSKNSFKLTQQRWAVKGRKSQMTHRGGGKMCWVNRNINVTNIYHTGNNRDENLYAGIGEWHWGQELPDFGSQWCFLRVDVKTTAIWNGNGSSHWWMLLGNNLYVDWIVAAQHQDPAQHCNRLSKKAFSLCKGHN